MLRLRKLPVIRNWIRNVELDDELQFHLEMETERLVEEGLAPRAARREARLNFGSYEAAKEACRDERPFRLLDDFRRDTREACRALARSPLFTVTAVTSLAAGIGACAVIFSLVHAVLLRPLPFDQAERLVRFWETTPQGDRFSTSDPNFLDFRERTTSLVDMAAIAFPPPQPSLRTAAGPELLSGLTVSHSFFDVLGTEPILGRAFGDEEAVPGSNPRVVLLSHAAWRGRFGGEQSIVGRALDLDGERFTVIGVLPEDFRFLSSPEIWFPFVPDADYVRADHRIEAIARLAPGVSLEQANAELEGIATALGERYPDSNDGWSALVVPFSEWLIGPQVERANLVLLGAVGLLLLLACANVSNLLLARASHRGSEIGLRLALGASRPRIVRQLLTESLVLGVAGAGAGLLLAAVTIPALRGLETQPFPRMDEMVLDGRVLAVVITIALATSVLFGLAPALHATAGSLSATGRTGRQDGGARRGHRFRTGLVVAELALAMVLAIGAGLLARSFWELSTVDAGFEVEGVVRAEIALPEERYPEQADAVGSFYRVLEERLAGMPGVESVGAGMVSPFRGPSPTNRVARELTTEEDNFVWVQWRGVTPGYFSTLRIPMLRGRSFQGHEEETLEAIVSAQLAERLWPGEDPLGRRVLWNRPDGPLFEVVGVVTEVRDLALESEPPPMIYLPQSVVGWPSMTVMLRTDSSPLALAPALEDAILELDPLLAPREIGSLSQNRSEALAGSRLNVSTLAVFSVVALVLAALGVFGLISYAVSRRRHEMGVRIALGARPRDLTRLVVRRGFALVGSGLLLGVFGAVAMGRFLEGLLFETSLFDPGVLIGVALLLALIGALASWAPARRASRLDPVTALRDD